MAEMPPLSIVITSYTVERLNDIYELLDSIKAQSYPDIETVFVIERSDVLFDRVRTYMREKAMPKTKVIFNHGTPGLSAARNLGIEHAEGDIIAFVDDDVVLFPDWAEAMVRTYKDDSVIGVTGPAFPLWEDESMSWLPEEFYWIISCTAFTGWNELRTARSVWGMNMSFRKEAFALAGTFSPAIGGIQGNRLHSEEVELSLRIKKQTKKRIVYNPNVEVNHKVYRYRLTPRFIARTSYWIGYTRQGLKRLYREGDEGKNLLNIEYQLLRHIFTRLPIDILKTLFRNPVIAWRKTLVTVIALFFVALGYYSYSFQNLLGRRKAAAYKEKAKR